MADPVLLTLPILIPLFTGVLALLAGYRPDLSRWIAAAGAAALLAAALLLFDAVIRRGVLVTQLGSWPAPFGVTLVADTFSAIMLVLTGALALAAQLYALADPSLGGPAPARRPSPRALGPISREPPLSILLMGVSGTLLTGDVFNLFVWFEVMLIASFVPLALGRGRAHVEGALKYVVLNLLASAMLLTGVAFLYGLCGTLNMAHAAERLALVPDRRIVTACSAFFLVAFGIKAAAFPLFFWLPVSYPTLDTATSALYAGLLTKVGVYALIRVFTLLFVHDVAFTHGLILIVSGLTMISGVLGAVVQHDLRRLLSFHIVSQIGYMLLGLGLFTAAGIAGAIFFIAHNMVVKANLFLISGVARRLRGTEELSELGDLYRTRPLLAAIFLVTALSLAGLPPLSGFFGKLALVRAGIARGEHLLVAVALGVSLLTLLSMLKIWSEAFWKPAPREGAGAPEDGRGVAGMLLPCAALAAISIAMGLGAGPAWELSARAAAELLHPAGYISAVLGPAAGGGR